MSKKVAESQVVTCDLCGARFPKKCISKHDGNCSRLSSGVTSVPLNHPVLFNGSLFCKCSVDRKWSITPELFVAPGTAKICKFGVGQPVLVQGPEKADFFAAKVSIADDVPFMECRIRTWNCAPFVRIRPFTGEIWDALSLSLFCEDTLAEDENFRKSAAESLRRCLCYPEQRAHLRYFAKNVYCKVVFVSTTGNHLSTHAGTDEGLLVEGLNKNLSNLKLATDHSDSDLASTDSPRASGHSGAERSSSSAPSISKLSKFAEFIEPKLPPRLYAVTEITQIGWIASENDFGGFEAIGGLAMEKTLLTKHIIAPIRHGLTGHAILVTGVSGVGKSTLLRSLLTEIGRIESEHGISPVPSKFTSAPDLADSNANIDTICRNLSTGVGVLVLDDLNLVVKQENQKNLLVASLISCIDRLCPRGLFLIVATTDPEMLPIEVRRRFDLEITVAPPDQINRSQILQKFVGEDHDTLAAEVSAKTHGYTPGDLLALKHNAERLWKSTNDGQLGVDHFESALTLVRPTAMREIILEVPKVHWSDIGGMEKVKKLLKQMVEWPLKHPDAFQRLGITPPSGVLLFGPPGCSKTMIARALATESGMNFISVKGPELFSKWVGESEKTVRELFARARAASPSIVFFDEIDAIGSSRGNDGGKSSVGDRVLAQLLTEIDGVEPLKNVVIVAATNRPDTLDSALLRPGRFDRLIYIPLPDESTRLEILKLQFEKIPLQTAGQKDKTLCSWAEKTEGLSGAEIVAVCREAALRAMVLDMNTPGVSEAEMDGAVLDHKKRVSLEMLTVFDSFVTRQP